MISVLIAIAVTQQGFEYKTNPRRLYQLKDLQRVEITLGKNKLKAWVMDTDSKRQEGMMFLKRTEVQANDAMLFVFPDAADRSFWMHNTLTPLDIAYISSGKKIVSTAQMKPLDETGTPSKGAAQFVVEMPQGAFKRLGIKAGQPFTMPKSIVAR